MADILEAAAGGRGLARGAAIRLLDPSTPSGPLLEAAARLRDRGKGRIITYSRKVFLPLTNLCRDRCGYCGFRREPNDPDGGFMAPEQVLAVVEEGARLGCTEALFSLGDAPEAVHPEARAMLGRLGHDRTMGYLRAACALVLDRSPLFPHANPGLMNEADLCALTPDFINPASPWPQLAELRRTTEARGFLLRRRLPVYPEYLLGRREFLAPELAERLRAAVGSDGLVPDA